MGVRNSCVVSSAGCCDGENEICPEKLLEGDLGLRQNASTGPAAAACWGNSSRDITYCETLVLPSGKSNISLGCHQDRYFPNGLWESATLFTLGLRAKVPCCLFAWH